VRGKAAATKQKAAEQKQQQSDAAAGAANEAGTMDDDPDAANSKKRGRARRNDGAHDKDPKRARVGGDEDAAHASGANVEEDAGQARGRSKQEERNRREKTLRNQRIVDAVNACALRDDTDVDPNPPLHDVGLGEAGAIEGYRRCEQKMDECHAAALVRCSRACGSWWASRSTTSGRAWAS